MKRERRAAALVAAILFSAALSACNGGMRPTLVADQAPTPQPALELDLAPAPAQVAPLPPASPDLALAATVDDALIAWARERAVPYTDGCTRITPGPGELCDLATERDTVRLLGPNPDEIWYVVTAEVVGSLDSGTGYRIVSVEIAGR